MRKVQSQLEETSETISRVQLRYDALKFNYVELKEKFESCELEKNLGEKFIEILKKENQTAILCIMKMLEIFKKQNKGLIDKEIEKIVIVGSRKNFLFFCLKI